MNDRKIRIIGVALFFGSFALAYFFAYLPLQAAKHHEDGISLSLKVTFLSPVAFIFGAFAAAFGARGRAWIQTEDAGTQKLRIAGWILVAVCIAAGIGFHQWLKSAISAYGYKF